MAPGTPFHIRLGTFAARHAQRIGWANEPAVAFHGADLRTTASRQAEAALFAHLAIGAFDRARAGAFAPLQANRFGWAIEPAAAVDPVLGNTAATACALLIWPADLAVVASGRARRRAPAALEAVAAGATVRAVATIAVRLWQAAATDGAFLVRTANVAIGTFRRAGCRTLITGQAIGPRVAAIAVAAIDLTLANAAAATRALKVRTTDLAVCTFR